MDKPQRLLQRLTEIGIALQSSGHALALLGLGSVGIETARLDAYSDLDFFIIVEHGFKQRYLQNLDWLAAAHPIGYAFLNTADGYKALYVDGIFCEFAVFEPQELSHIPFAEGRIVWQAGGFDPTLAAPPPRHRQDRAVEWLLGEALTNLYVGMGRVRRGEILSGTRFIQGYAVDRVVELAAHLEAAQPHLADPFTGERRFEFRYPATSALLASFMQGYLHNHESALAVLAFLERHFAVNPAIANAIRELCSG